MCPLLFVLWPCCVKSIWVYCPPKNFCASLAELISSTYCTLYGADASVLVQHCFSTDSMYCHKVNHSTPDTMYWSSLPRLT